MNTIFALTLLASQVSPPDGMVLFPLIGQSNMTGIGALSEAPVGLVTPTPDVWVFGNDYAWREAVEPLDSSIGQLDLVSKDVGTGVGPGMAFARQYVLDHPGIKVGLIPCAKSSRTLHEWRRQITADGLMQPVRTNLYSSCLHRIRQAEAYGKVGGLLIYMGESDTRDPSVVSFAQPFTYGVEFARFIAHWRADLGVEVPVVFAQLAAQGPEPSFVHWALVQQGQAQARDILARAAMIETSDLELGPDGLHLPTSSQVTLGQRMAKALNGIEGGTP